MTLPDFRGLPTALAIALAILPVGLGAALLAIATPAVATEYWNTTFASTQAGHRVGNPDAATTLVTFVSYTCPHCAEFEQQSDGPLRVGYIHPGKVLVEVRHLIRNPIDLAAALATECGPAPRFFARHRAMMSAHDRWMRRASAATPAQQQRWSTGAMGGRMRAIAGDLDFYQFMAPFGLSTAQLDRCLTDAARARAIATTSQEQSERFAIPGTPSFVVDGKLLEGVHTWSALQRALDERS